MNANTQHPKIAAQSPYGEDFMHDFLQELVNSIVSSKWFLAEAEIIISETYGAHDDEPIPYAYSYLMPLILAGKVNVYLPRETLGRIINGFTIPQLHYILFGYWYGLREDVVDIYARAEWQPHLMCAICKLLTIDEVPAERVRAVLEECGGDADEAAYRLRREVKIEVD